MTTFVNLRTQCAARFRDTAKVVVTDAQWKEYINQAYQRANTSSPLWPWLETSEQTVTVVANTRGIALPADVLQVNWVYDTTDNLRLIPQEGRGDQWRSDNLRTDTSIPVTYRLRASNIEVFPLPTANTDLVLECISYPIRMAADADVPVWPSVFHEILIPGALALAYMDDGNIPFSDKQQARFDASVEEMNQALLFARVENYTPIRDTFWG